MTIPTLYHLLKIRYSFVVIHKCIGFYNVLHGLATATQQRKRSKTNISIIPFTIIEQINLKLTSTNKRSKENKYCKSYYEKNNE